MKHYWSPFNLFGGVIADRFRRKKIIILSDFLSGLACIALSFISDNTWLIYMIIAANVFLAFLSSFSTPAYNAFTKEVVEKDNIALLNSYLQTAAMVVKIVIPIVVVGVYRFAFGWCFLYIIKHHCSLCFSDFRRKYKKQSFFNG